MDRRLARKNIRTGLIVGAISLFMFGLTFVAAAIYVSRETERARAASAPPVGEEIHLPGPDASCRCSLRPSASRWRWSA